MSDLSDAGPDGTPAALRRCGTALLNQQFWLWGQDIRRPEGNVLLAHGFRRARPPEGVKGSPSYALDLGGDRSLVLWGFGLFLGDRALGGIYVSRFRLAPLLILDAEPPAGVWSPSQLPPRRPPADAAERAVAWTLLGDAVRWLAAYERWVQATYGVAHRQGLLHGWGRAVCPVERMPMTWSRLACRTERTRRRAHARSAAPGAEGGHGG